VLCGRLGGSLVSLSSAFSSLKRSWSRRYRRVLQLTDGQLSFVIMSTKTNEPASSGLRKETEEDVKVVNNIAPADAVAAIQKKKEPPPETPESIRLRSLVITSFWAIVLLFGLPLWWETTTIYRAPLPLDQMIDWAEGRVCQLF
jgi:hypothetical protein